MISKIERIVALRYLRPKKKEGFLKIISIFSFTGIALGVAIGAATDNLAVGIGIGVALGAAMSQLKN